MTLSVIIPVYNVEPYVQRCLESVMAQEVSTAMIECIVVDDCGRDASMGIVRRLIDGYDGPERWKVVAHAENRGLSAARNTGVAHATGDYVLFIDSDDYLLPGSMDLFARQLKANPGVDMVVGNVKNCKNNSLLLHWLQSPMLIRSRDELLVRMLRHSIYLYAWNKMIKRSLLTENGIAFIEGIVYEDQSWSYLLSACLSSVLLLTEVTYVYEYNEKSIVNGKLTRERLDHILHSYAVSTSTMLDNPPAADRYERNMTVDYLLFMSNYMMNGFDMLSKLHASPSVESEFRLVRKRLLLLALRYGRGLVAAFFLLMYAPFRWLQKIAAFRHHYFAMESVAACLFHRFDFLHNKYRL